MSLWERPQATLGRRNPCHRGPECGRDQALLDPCGRGGASACPGRKPKDWCGLPMAGFRTPRSPGWGTHVISALLVIGSLFAIPVIFLCCAPAMARAEAKARREFGLRDSNLRSSHTWDELIYFDKQATNFRLPKELFGISTSDRVIAVGGLDHPRIIPASKIISVETVLDRNIVVTGGSSAVAVHGIALGSGRARARSLIKSIDLKLVVADPADPIVEIEFFSAFGKGAPARSTKVRAAEGRLERMRALLAIAMHAPHLVSANPARS